MFWTIIWKHTFWANSCCLMICLPVFPISVQMASLCPPSWRIVGVAPEAVTRRVLRADLCALLRRFHIGRVDTCSPYVHVLPQLTSMDRNWENVLFRCECLFWLLYLQQPPLNGNKQWEEWRRMSSHNLRVLSELLVHTIKIFLPQFTQSRFS